MPLDMDSYCSSSILLKMSREQLVVERTRKAFLTGSTKPLKFRIQQLQCLLRFITERRKDIADAVHKDLYKVTSAHVTGSAVTGLKVSNQSKCQLSFQQTFLGSVQSPAARVNMGQSCSKPWD